MPAGRLSDAVARGARAAELNPLDPATRSVAAWAYLAAGMTAEGLAAARRAFELDSASAFARPTLALAELKSGMRAEALVTVRTSVRTPLNSGLIGYVLGATGDRAAATLLLAQLERERAVNWAVNRAMMLTWLGLGDTDGALASLERGVREHEPLNLTLLSFADPMFDPIRSSPRFVAVLRSYGIDEHSLVYRR